MGIKARRTEAKGTCTYNKQTNKHVLHLQDWIMISVTLFEYIFGCKKTYIPYIYRLMQRLQTFQFNLEWDPFFCLHSDSDFSKHQQKCVQWGPRILGCKSLTDLDMGDMGKHPGWQIPTSDISIWLQFLCSIPQTLVWYLFYDITHN